MGSHSRAWSTSPVGVAVTMVALVQPAAAIASQDRSSVLVAITTKTDELSAVVRVSQVGYPTGAPKVAFAMLPQKVVSWPSVEPADDYTANSLLAFALGAGADQGSGLG